jgi:anti-sigma-K factor RskA
VEHCEPDLLALAALGEPLPSDDAAHLAACDRCRAEVASLRRGVDLLAVPEFAASGPSVPPPPHVWAAIAAATGVHASPASAPAEPALTAVPSAPATDDTVRQLRPRRTRLLLAAAAVVVIAAGAGAVAMNRNDEVTLASASLAPVGGDDAKGSASVVEEDDGTRVLRIDLDAPAAKDAFYEAWLADPSAVGMISMGNVRPGTTSLPVPDGLDLGKWPTVEISVEPVDGDPGHSGVSLARGQLST